jgi:hypothetical protein
MRDGKFEVGDKVRLVESYFGGSIEKGDIGVVTGFRDNGVIARFDNSVKPKNENGDDGWWCEKFDITLVESYVAPTTPTTTPIVAVAPIAVNRIIGADIDGLRFVRTGDVVEVHVGTDADSVSSSTTIVQLREMMRIIDEEATNHA